MNPLELKCLQKKLSLLLTLLQLRRSVRSAAFTSTEKGRPQNIRDLGKHHHLSRQEVSDFNKISVPTLNSLKNKIRDALSLENHFESKSQILENDIILRRKTSSVKGGYIGA